MFPELNEEAIAEHLKPINEITDKLVASQGKAELTRDEFQRGRQAARDILEMITPLNRAGNPINRIDARIATHLRANQATIQPALQTILATRKPAPLDYYEIYYQVLQDSGLLRHGLPDPKELGELAATLQSREGIFIFDKTLKATGGCSGCSACLTCGGCASCIICVTKIGVAAVAATSATGGALGAVGFFF